MQFRILACGTNGTGTKTAAPAPPIEKFPSAERVMPPCSIHGRSRAGIVQRGGKRTPIGVCASAPINARNFVLSSCIGNLPQIAHFEHFMKGIDERRGNLTTHQGNGWIR